MIKLFGKGLGLEDDRMSLTAENRLSKVEEKSSFDDLKAKKIADIKKRAGEFKPVGESHVVSEESGPLPFETLFHDFNIEAFPFYNFWTSDELTNDKDVMGNRSYDDIPRFIKIAWNPAPDIRDPEEVKKPKDVAKRKIRDVVFSRDAEREVTFDNRGIAFAPEHLQPRGFSKLKGMIANGHISPGVIEAVVDLPLETSGLRSPSANLAHEALDEDEFLLNKSFSGVSFHELKANILHMDMGLTDAVVDNMTSANREDDAINNKVSIQKSLRRGGMMSVTSVHPSSPSLSISARTAQSSLPDIVNPVLDIAEPAIRKGFDQKHDSQIKVKFFNTSLGGLLDPKKINLASRPEHVEMLMSLAPALPNLEVLTQSDVLNRRKITEIPSVPSPKLKRFEYVGYVLEKYVDNGGGVFSKVGDIDIPNRESDFYIDTQVLYGKTYRYRIRCVARWTRSKDTGVDGEDKSIVKRFGSQTEGMANFQSSYFYSEWGRSWAYGACIDDQPPGPPDELTVLPDSQRKRVTVTFRLPYNPQRDILKMRLMRRLQNANGEDQSSWVVVRESDASDRGVDFAPQNVLYVDTDVDFFQKSGMKFIYAAQCITRHGEYSVLSEQLACRLNENFRVRGEYPVEFVSSPGVRLESFGSFNTTPHHITKTEVIMEPPPTRLGKSPGVVSLLVSGRDTMGRAALDDSHYILRVQSLDTGEIVDIPTDVTFNNYPTREVISANDSSVKLSYSDKMNSDKFQSDRELRNELQRHQDGVLVDSRDESGDVFVYDRPSPGDRW